MIKKLYIQVQRSVSQSDMHDSSGRRGVRLSNTNTTSSDATVHSGTKLKRCASLPAQKQQNIPFAKDLKTQRESSVESLGKLKIKTISN